MEQHLTDSEIQQLAFEPDQPSQAILDHLYTCASCSARLEFYAGNFSSLRQTPREAFDFDLSAAVMSQIKHINKLPQRLIQVIFFLALAAGISVLTYWGFKKYLHELFTGFSYMLIFLLLAAILSFMCFQLWETWRKYQQKIDALNLF